MNTIEHLSQTRNITREELELLLTTDDRELVEQLRRTAREVADGAEIVWIEAGTVLIFG